MGSNAMQLVDQAYC